MKLFLLLSVFFVTEVLAFEKVKLNGKIYVPDGYDNNDLIEVTAVGVLPSSCYKNPTFSIERKEKSYLIRLYAYYIPNPNGCREISSPYFETINFGMMQEGDYQLTLVQTKKSITEKLRIKASSSSLVDDFSYGNITGILEDNESRDITLIGINPTDCMEIQTIDTEIQASMIVLRPQFKENGFCKNRPTPFEIKYRVPFIKDGPQGVLIHARVMNGRSFNYLYQNRL